MKFEFYKTDGSSHHNGVNNETQTISILNELNIYSSPVMKVGGTQHKEDAIVENTKLSIKRKKGIENGSFDWINTSKYEDYIEDIFGDFLSSMKEMRNLPPSILEDPLFISQVRNNFNSLCDTSLNNLQGENAIKFLRRVFLGDDFEVIVNDIVNRCLYVFDLKNHPVIEYLNRNYSAILQGSAKSSRKVVFSDGINYYDCGLRIRVHSNNGVSAFLGLSKANPNSHVVLKLQQDNIPQLIELTKAKRHDY